MNNTNRAMPDFERPPVIEVVCGVQFRPLAGLLAPHLGRFWERVRADYPGVREVAPLARVIERYDEGAEGEIEFGDVPPLPRLWFVHKSENGLIQVQRDRFLHNWRKVRDTDEYPRYATVIRMFRDRWGEFQSFVGEEQLGPIQPSQYEMTYVNHIPRGPAWDALGEIGKVFPDFRWRADPGRFLPTPETINWRTTFLLPERRGRLHVTVRRVVHRETRRPMLLLDLTARGFTQGTSPDAMWAWFDTAREWIVRGFADITGGEVQEKVWIRRNRA